MKSDEIQARLAGIAELARQDPALAAAAVRSLNPVLEAIPGCPLRIFWANTPAGPQVSAIDVEATLGDALIRKSDGRAYKIHSFDVGAGTAKLVPIAGPPEVLVKPVALIGAEYVTPR